MQTSFLSQISQEQNISQELAIIDEGERKNAEKRVFHFWLGKNVFLFKGQLMLGPSDSRWFLYSYILVVIFFSLIFYEAILPNLETSNNLEISIGFSVCIFFLCLFSVLTSATEPGVLPHSNLIASPSTLNLERAEHKKVFESLSERVDANKENIQAEEKNSKKIILEDASSTEKQTKRFCSACKIYKPTKAYHCVKCNNCVRNFSHHCMLVNNCIGKRNYKYFMLMIFFGFCSDLYFVTCLVFHHSKIDPRSNFFYKMFLFVIAFFSILVLCFCAYYLVTFLFGWLFEKKETADVDTELPSENNDFCQNSPSMIHFEKVINEIVEKQISVQPAI